MTGSTALEGLLAVARRHARARGQQASTAHVLLAILQSDAEAGALLDACEVREQSLVSALKVANEEPRAAIEVAVERAAQLARRSGSAFPRPVHLLGAVLREPRWAAYRCLEHMGRPAGAVRQEVERLLQPEPAAAPTARGPRPSPAMPALGRTRATFATPRARTSITGPGGAPASGLPILPSHKRMGARPAPKNRRIAPKTEGASADALLESADTRAARPAATKTASAEAPALGAHELDRERFPLLASIGRNLTALAASGRIDPVIGRERELEHLLDVLCRRRSNNPLLVGPPGVGKTALAEGLALRMAAGELPGLSARVLLEISAGSLVSGTGVRGALAERLRRLREEVAKAEGSVLLFLDEIHAIVGGEGGPDDLVSELKGALARGELPCVGATTEAEYEKYIARDPALARRFTRIDVREPSVDDAIEILMGIAPRYERHHAVAFDPEAVRASVELTHRFVPERQLPDKALSALDLAAARVRRAGGNIVGLEDVARVVADEAHVPLERLMMRDADRLLALESHLADSVVGQREPIARIADALRKGAAGFRGRRPLATFLLLGSTGVGKTETAKAIADQLFGSSGMSRIDMSEFGAAHSVARLFGAPPGYVGHDEGGQLTESVRKRPYQLVLLDEIEKAHPDVLLALLPLLDEGRLTDGRGRTVDFTNTVVVMTSNLGANAAAPKRAVGFANADLPSAAPSASQTAIAAARRAMPPELWNRIDEPLFFAPLTKHDVAQIAERMVMGTARAMRREHGIELELEHSAVEVLVEAGFDPALGARPMRRAIGSLVESPLAAMILAGEVVRGQAVVLRGEGGKLRLQQGEFCAADAAE